MTCIVAYRDSSGVVLGVDSLASNGHIGYCVEDDKIVAFGDPPYALLGYTTSFRGGQLLRKLDLPHPLKHVDVFTKQDNIVKYVYEDLSDAIRKIFKGGGFLKTHNGEESGMNALLVYGGEIYELQNDFSILQMSLPYMAIGSGQSFALGSFQTNEQYTEKSKRERCTDALRAAATHCVTVSEPFFFAEIFK